MEGEIELAIYIDWGVMLLIVILLILFASNYRTKTLQAEKEAQILAFTAAIEAEEKQKEKTANDLHDEILPLLTALSQNIKQHQKDFRDKSFDQKEFLNDLELIEKSTKGMRSIALGLIPTTFINFGLIKAMEQYIGQISTQDKIIDFHDTTNFGKVLPFKKVEQINIYRIYTEILSNLGKHSFYNCLTISLENKKNLFLIQFKHDGHGISTKEIEELSQSANGLGLKSLKTRMLILDATIDYTEERGVPTINVNIPLENEL